MPFFVALRGPSWTKGCCSCRSSRPFVALRGPSWRVSSCRSSRPFVDKKKLPLPFFATLRDPSRTKRCCSCRSPRPFAALRGQNVLPLPAHRTPPHNLSQPLTFRTTYCNNRIVPARRPLSSPCTVCSPPKEHRHVHVALFHLPARTEPPPPAQDRRPPGDPHSYCRSILMRTKCSPCGRNPPRASTLLHLRPARTGRPHRSLQRHRRTGLARQQQLAQPETILNLVRRYHRKQWLRHPPRPPE